ncbi:MAG: phage portal protein [Bacteroidales bacterium]|nr:phage portal protein [Bacteroidales bacterium]
MVKAFSAIARVFGRKNTLDNILAELFQAGVKSGVTVNWKTALEAAISYRCARVLAEGIAQVPFKLFRDDGKNRFPATDHPLYDLLAISPNERQSSFEFRDTMMMHVVFTGGAFAFINRSGRNGEISELLQYEPGAITVKRNGWDTEYEVVTNSGKKIVVPSRDMWHLRGPSWNGWMGLDGVKLAREAIGLSIAAEEYGALFFRNGSTPSGLLSTDQQLAKEKAAELREAWEESNSGEKRLKTAVLWGGMKWMSLATPNDQAQFLETRKFQIEEVCRALGVNPLRAYYSDKTATYASAEQFFISHVVHDLMPWYVRIEQSANLNLLTKEERKAGYYFKFIANGLMRGSMKDRIAYYKDMVLIHAMKPNEVRELEEMNPYDGGDEFPVLQGQGVARSNEQGSGE